MPLSDHEQRLLEQIERALYAEDPKFATTVRSTDLKRHYKRRVIKGAVLFALGMAVLLGGTVSKVIPVGVAGFLLMVGGALVAVAGWKRLTGSPESALTGRLPREHRARIGVLERLEERWKSRRDDSER